MKVKLSDAFDLQMGKTPSRDELSYWGGTNKWISIADMSRAEKYIGSTKEFITDKGVQESGIKPVPKGTVLMSFKLSIGKTAITAEDMYTNEAIMAFIDRHKYKIDADYLYYLLNGTDWKADTNRAVLGLTLNKTTLAQHEISIPALNRQRYVADVLDRIVNLIGLHRQQLAKLDELVKSQFVEWFGDPVSNSKNFPVYPLSDFILFLTSGSRGWAKYHADSGEWFITITNVKNCKITTDNIQHIIPPHNVEADRTRVQEGDLLISITADLGRTGVVTADIAEHGAYINQHLTLIRLNRDILNPYYVASFMESEAGKRQFEAKNLNSVKAGLNFDSIRSLQLMVPPLDLQNQFTAFVEQSDKSKYAIRRSIEKLEMLKASLMQEYFR